MEEIEHTTVETEQGELSRLPQMNNVVLEAEKVLDGVGDKMVLKERIMELDAVIHQMIQFYNYEVKFQEKTDDFLDEADIIEQNFAYLQESIEKIKHYYCSNEPADLEEGLDGALEALDYLFESFDILKEMEQKRPIYSRSPLLNEVMRVAHNVMKGSLPADTLRERLEAFIKMQQNVLANIDYTKPVGNEGKVYEQNSEEIKQALRDMIEGLKQARNYFTDFNPEHVEIGLEKANKAADFLMDIQEEFKEAREAPRVKYCFKCGAENPEDVKFCVECNFNFPPLELKETSTVDLRIEEEGIKQTGHVMTENVLKLATAVDDVKTGKIRASEFREILEWFRELQQTAKQEAEAIEDPQVDDKEAMEAFHNFKETFYLGMSEIEEGLKKLFTFLEAKNVDLLRVGLEQVMAGTDRLFQVKTTADQLVATVEAQQAQAPPEEMVQE